MTLLEIKNISKAFSGGIQAVDDFSLDVNETDFIVLVGPSGCGKTTVLRMIAGLEGIDEGTLLIDDVDVAEMSPKERDVAMIFQDYALYPHLTVKENIAFPLHMHGFPKLHITQLVEEIAKNLHIYEILDRKPGALSGGQRQRVAIARALVRKPKICLMDEPFSNLDAQLRVQMRGELARIHQEYNMTTLFVTHDQVEAMALGTRIVVMKDGVIQQAASSVQLYQNPANLFVAQFFGVPPINTFPAVLLLDDEVWRAHLGENEESTLSTRHIITLDQKQCISLDPEYSGSKVILGMRPEHVRIALDEDSNAFLFTGEVQRIETLGSEGYYYCRSFGEPLVVCVSPNERHLKGAVMSLAFDPHNCFVFDAKTGINLFFSDLEQYTL